MNIIAIYPHIGIENYSISFVLTGLVSLGHKVYTISSRGQSLKGNSMGVDKINENMNGVHVFRPYQTWEEMYSKPMNYMDSICEFLGNIKPDVILCSHQMNITLGKNLQKRYQEIPLILIVEMISDYSAFLGKRRNYLGLKFLMPLFVRLKYRTYKEKSAAIITGYHKDLEFLKSKSFDTTHTYHIPWCNQLPLGYQDTLKRPSSRSAIHVGSLSEFKNTAELLILIPKLIKLDIIDEFIVIGDGPELKIITNLMLLFPHVVKHLFPVDRMAVLNLMAQCKYAITTVKTGGWGFIGDALASKTLLVVSHNDFGIDHMHDGIVLNSDTSEGEIVKCFADEEKLSIIIEHGYGRYLENHSAEVIAQKYHEVITSEGVYL